MTFLLDVNVVIALIDPMHVHHELTQLWFEREGARSWASCPLTENGVLRIVGSPGYGNSPGSPRAVASILTELCALPGHLFWSDDLSLLDSDIVEADRLARASQVTDTYLLALACSKGGRLASLDRRLVTSTVRGGDAALRLIG